ncbi:TIGR02391 family protein [Streptomyces sp. SAI-170]|uniref:TIGR02391 family protein n=1 Tax=Streptomyces sp. SAI-170 TaxID=3377729 RepID=UPI003C7A7C9B
MARSERERRRGETLEMILHWSPLRRQFARGALRNPRMHGPDEKDARDEADEMLVFASFLMRRLDIEDEKREVASSGT